MPDTAKRTDWKCMPMPTAKAKLNFERTYTEEEYKRMNLGLIPQEMEDKWFIFLEADVLYLHRSWTGFCIYEVHFERTGNRYTVSEVWANRDKEQYKNEDQEYDQALLDYLIGRILLDKNVPFPNGKEKGTATASLAQFHIVGHGRSNEGQ